MIYLTGFMGSGKSTVGHKLAALMHNTAVDMDDVIVEKTGSSIPDIFTYAGEKAFRFIEQEVLVELAAGDNRIIATGGGLPVNPANREIMKASGIIVHLRASLQTLKKRVPEGEDRPLWNQDVDQLFASRQDAYADADIIIETDAMDAEAVAQAVFDKVKDMPVPVAVVLKDRPYPIYIGNGIFSGIKRLINRRLKPEGLFVLMDSTVLNLHLERIQEALADMSCHIKEVPAGEASKSTEFLNEVLCDMLALKMNRQWACLAIGGGVTNDLAGFAASIFMRGIPVIQVPTTLLAQVDASIGGKTGINHDLGKNLIGTIHQPACVLCDTAFLSTLDEDQISGGLAEVIKYGIIMDIPLFEELEAAALDYENIVRMCCRDKAYVVSHDEHEAGLRRILNFGHTLGHALEQHMAFKVHHGVAVAFGMLFATWLSHDLGLLSLEDKQRILGLINKHHILPDDLTNPPREAISQAMALDKKSVKDGIHFVLTAAIGESVVKRLTLTHILEAYERFSHGYQEAF